MPAAASVSDQVAWHRFDAIDFGEIVAGRFFTSYAGRFKVGWVSWQIFGQLKQRGREIDSAFVHVLRKT